jgi:hypothetical protein
MLRNTRIRCYYFTYTYYRTTVLGLVVEFRKYPFWNITLLSLSLWSSRSLWFRFIWAKRSEKNVLNQCTNHVSLRYLHIISRNTYYFTVTTNTDSFLCHLRFIWSFFFRTSIIAIKTTNLTENLLSLDNGTTRAFLLMLYDHKHILLVLRTQYNCITIIVMVILKD